MPNKFEAGVIVQVIYVVLGAGKKIIGTYHFMALREQAVSQMGPEETGASRYKNALPRFINTGQKSTPSLIISNDLEAGPNEHTTLSKK